MQSYITLLSLLFFFISVQLHAQTRDKTIFHYSDGSVFIGTILKENSQDVKLRISTADTINIKKLLVKKAYRDLLFFSGGKFHFRKGGFFHFSQSLGSNSVGDGSYQLQAIFGRHYNERLDYGFGLGFSTNTTSIAGVWGNAQFFSPMLHARYYLSSKKVRPFLSGSLGYSFPLETWGNQNFSGGLFFQPAIGFKFASKRMSRITLGIGQMIQRTKGDFNDTDFLGNPVEGNFKLFLNRTVFSIGFDIR